MAKDPLYSRDQQQQEASAADAAAAAAAQSSGAPDQQHQQHAPAGAGGGVTSHAQPPLHAADPLHVHAPQGRSTPVTAAQESSVSDVSSRPPPRPHPLCAVDKTVLTLSVDH